MTTPFICLPEAPLDDLDGAEIGLLVTLYRYADAGRTCYPSHDTLAAKVKRSRQWVFAALKRMEKLGIIKVERRRRADGGKTSSVYSLPTHVNHVDMGVCNPERQGHVNQGDINKTQESTTPTPARAREGGASDSDVRVVPFGKQPVPADWQPSAASLAWGQQAYPNCDLSQFTESFVLQCGANGYRYADIDSAWKKWLKDDHKKFTKGAASDRSAAGRHLTRFEHSQLSDSQLDEYNDREAARLAARMAARRGSA